MKSNSTSKSSGSTPVSNASQSNIARDKVGKDGVQYGIGFPIAELPLDNPDFIVRLVRIGLRSLVHRGGDETAIPGRTVDPESKKLLTEQTVTAEQYAEAVFAYGFRGESNGPTAADKREAKKWIAAKGGGDVEKISEADWTAIAAVVKRKFDVTLEERTVAGLEKLCMGVRLASSILS